MSYLSCKYIKSIFYNYLKKILLLINPNASYLKYNIKMTEIKNDNNLLIKAQENKNKGMEELKTCCILFKCKPDYESAIPYLKEASTKYGAVRNFKEEIFCRNHLVECFRKTKSLWEEGNELEKIAYIQVNELNDYNEAYKTIINAHNAYYAQGDYQEATNCIYKIAIVFKQNKYLDLCEKVLKISFGSSVKFGHVVICKDEVCDYIYKTFNFYVGILFVNDKTRLVIESCDILAKSIESYEKQKTEIFNIYLTKAIALIINEDSSEELEKCYSECENWISDTDDSNKLESLKKIRHAIIDGKEGAFNTNLYEVCSSLDNEVTKKLKQAFDKSNEEKNKHNLDNVKDSFNEDNKEKYL